MPAVSQSQQRLFAASLHGADFPLARKIRATMPKKTQREFAHTRRQNLPDHIRAPKPKAPKMPSAAVRQPTMSMGSLYTRPRGRR